jgi:tetratricopeptide (TPR) repeat protein
VLGDFNGARFEHHGQRTEFLRRGGRYLVRTQGADGRMQELQATHVLGVYPLQQLLIALPGGRLQALGIAWDARPRDQGGQRWYALYPEDPPAPGDALHWSGRDQNANFMCLGCHATGYHKGYDEATDTYRSTQAELGVGCEACHGPGSAHRDWARAGRADDAGKGLAVPQSRLRRRVFAFLPGAAIARAQDAGAGGSAAMPCLGCHARRGQLVDEARPQAALLDQYSPSLIEPGLYHPDGRMDGEVFEYGSFAQSAMHAAGVSCTHCHDAHSLRPRAAGDALCLQCHQASAYGGTAHAPAVGTQRGCVDCHMPTRTYMGVHARHDHSLRPPGAQARESSSFVRASRLAADADATAIAAAVGDEDDLVRLGAARALSRLPARVAAALGGPLLEDQRLAVRTEAARALAGLPWPSAGGSGPPALQRATAELLQAERESAERPQAQLNLAGLHLRLGQPAQAEAALRRALWLDPGFAPACVNLADLLRLRGRDAEAGPLLRQAVAQSPRDGVPAHALGLWLVRQGRPTEALPWLRKAWELSPGATHARTYGLALAESGQLQTALRVLNQAHDQWPLDATLLRSLIAIEQGFGLNDAAKNHALKLQKLTAH